MKVAAKFEVLAALTPHLPLELLREALDLAHGLGNETDCAYVLAALAPHLPRRKRRAVAA